MSEQPPINPEETEPAWLTELHRQREEEAAKFPGHTLDEDGLHDSDACRVCLETQTVTSECRCGLCCRLLIEVDVEDAEREPRIKEKGSPILTPAAFSPDGKREVVGYLLNSADNGHACAFLDRESNLCSIYPTRPLVCRLFDCAGEGRQQLIELGYLDRNKRAD